MKSTLSNESGFAMVVALSFVLGLGLLAVIVMVVSSTEKNTAFNDYTYTRSFYAADAGGEAAINWLRIQGSPPGMLDPEKHVHLPTGYDNLNQYKDDHKFKFDITYVRKRLRPGWSVEYKDFEYAIESDGASVADAESEVEVNALRLFKEGY
jgi:hypothetical protein